MAIDTRAIETHSSDSRRISPSAEFSARARIKTNEEYQELYRESLESPETFWARETSDLFFRTRWNQLLDWKPPFAKWFLGATLNASESCLDRHLTTERKNARAIVWEGEPGETRSLTYAELHQEVVKLSAVLRGLGVKKGIASRIYMAWCRRSWSPCSRVRRRRATHGCFGGFVAESLRDRIKRLRRQGVLTQDGGWRRGQIVPLKANRRRCLGQPPSVEKVRC